MKKIMPYPHPSDFSGVEDDHRGLFARIREALGGPMAGWARLVAAFAFVMGFLFVFAVWQLLHADTTRDLILWATATLAALIAQGFIKEWFFARMNTFWVLGAIKQLEARIDALEEPQDGP